MDELLHHCLRELSFDGDFGCNIGRLRDFVVEFYAHAGAHQNVDDAFCAFVWSLVVQQPTVRVGTKPTEVTSEVWVAPQVSAKRKAKARGEEHVETTPAHLNVVPDAKKRSLEDLEKEYGDKLRVAVDPDAIYEAITGSHIRFAKLSPMVYTALQIVTRGRENGVSVVQLGQESGYDQKTCFYLVRQLTELDLVVKVRRGGVGTNFCIHKYFFERSSSWQAIREEENRAQISEHRTPAPKEQGHLEDQELVPEGPPLDFTPIDARHLSSLPLIRSRVVKLLKASKNYMHPSNNLLITLGFSNPTKTDRRFFQSRIRELIQQGVIEKVIVPSNRKKSVNASVKCFRLVSKDTPTSQEDGEVVVQPQDAEDDKEELVIEMPGVKANLTIHKQIIDLLEEAGERGMTLNEISSALCQFDKRTIELLLTRAEKYSPPPHLSDLGVAGLMETSGRERRHRYFTVAAYRKMVEKENLEDSAYANADFSRVGDFQLIEPTAFFQDSATLFRYQDSCKDIEDAKSGKLAKKGRARSVADEDAATPRSSQKRKREEGAKGHHALKRRRTETKDKDAAIQQGDKPAGSPKPSKKRGRPPKEPTHEGTGAEAQLPKKRGRPRKSEPEKPLTSKRRKKGPPPEKAPDLGEPGEQPSERVEEVRAQTLLPVSRSVGATSPLAASGSEASRGLGQGNSAMDTAEAEPLLAVEPASRPRSFTTSEVPLIAQDAASSAGSTWDREMMIDPVLLAEGSRRVQLDRDTQTILEGIPSQSMSAEPGVVQSPLPEKTDADESGKFIRTGRVNVSHLRRENELYRVIEKMGGIVNIQTKEFFDEHMALLESLAKAGEATSAPVGTRTDKRTASMTFDTLERRGKIKQLKTLIMTHTGVQRPATIVYIPTVTQEQLKEFLSDLAQGFRIPPSQPGNVVKIDERVEYGADQTKLSRAALPLQLLQMEHPSTGPRERWSKNVDRANQLFSYDDNIIREVLLTERTTLGQMYGFIVGKALRARELHLFTLDALAKGDSSPHIVDREHKIVHLSYFCYDVPVAFYLSIVSALSHDEGLSSFLSTEEGRKTLVRDLPSNLHFLLQIGRSRARSRFLDILEILRAMKLVTPLQPSTSDVPYITRPSTSDKHPITFDIASDDGWSISTPMTAPLYWRFNDTAPLYILGLSEEAPPFWKDVSVACRSDAEVYWDLLEDACDPNNHIVPSSSTSSTGPPSSNVAVARSLRRSVSWNPEYIFTWHQTQYLRQFIQAATAKTPLQDDDNGDTQLTNISGVVSAPVPAVVSFYQSACEKLLKAMGKASKKAEQRTEKAGKRAAAAKASLMKKAADARNQRETEWQNMVQRLHPEPLDDNMTYRTRQVRDRFMQVGSLRDVKKWEREFLEAIREADIASRQVLRVAGKRRAFAARTLPVPLRAPPPVVSNPPEKSVQSLIALQGPPLEIAHELKRKRKKKGEELIEAEKSAPKAQRRHRFQWNRDFDELARDASAIIRARCRNLPRLDWGAFEQVFPSVPRNTVRQRLAHIKEVPGNEAYLNRLEDRWYELWLKHRGTDLLPDEDPLSASNFDLIKHVEFLRQHVDKNALRVGFIQEKDESFTVLPTSIEKILEQFDIVESLPNAPTWDFMWNAIVEEGREKKLLHRAFMKGSDDLIFPHEISSEKDLLAESAMKMTLGTPNERYDPQKASTLLHAVGESHVTQATKNLLNRGVLSKIVRDPTKQRPGRQLKISEMNQNAMGGTIPEDTFQDAAQLEELSFQHNAWREWPLLATDGDSAALMQLCSDNKVEFRVDTTHARLARPTIDWNSKKADDDQIENTIYFKTDFSSALPVPSSIESSPVIGPLDLPPTTDDHGKTEMGENACCRLASASGLVDCKACLDDEWTTLLQTCSGNEEKVASDVMEALRQAGKNGLAKQELKTRLVTSESELAAVLKKMTQITIPLSFWAGYRSVVLVSSAFLRDWTLLVSEEPAVRVFPRRWTDISGSKIVDFWEAALRAVMGVVVFKPGISQAELRWRLRSVYDRHEVADILSHLQTEGFLRLRCDPDMTAWIDTVMDDCEERRVYWFVGEEKHWYQV